MKEFLDSYGIIELGLMAFAAVAFLIQLYYYLGKYGRIPGYRQKVNNDASQPGISIVVIVENDFDYIENVLPKLMAQDYEQFEVVLVNNGSSSEFSETLNLLSARHSNLKYTTITPDPKFTYRRKFALNVGIKACNYPNIIFTETDTTPTSRKWLPLMAKGFTTGDVVIGYCGLEVKPGLANRMMRWGRLMQSVRYLSSAINGKPYRGISRNMGFTSKLYFDNKGYNYLNMSIGDEDLFVSSIATAKNTSIVMNRNATTRQAFYGGLSRWFAERKYYSYGYKYYPDIVRASVFTELLSRAVFFGSAIALTALQLPVIWIIAASAIVLRFFAAYLTMMRICRRLGEKKLIGVYIFHDLFSPIYEAVLSISRTMRPSKGIWN